MNPPAYTGDIEKDAIMLRKYIFDEMGDMYNGHKLVWFSFFAILLVVKIIGYILGHGFSINEHDYANAMLIIAYTYLLYFNASIVRIKRRMVELDKMDMQLKYIKKLKKGG